MEKLQDKINYAIEYSSKEFNEVAREFYNSEETRLSRLKLQSRIKTGKFTQEELKRIADIMNCEYCSMFVLKNGEILADGNQKFKEKKGNLIFLTFNERVKIASIQLGKTLSQVAEDMDMSPSLFKHRLNNEKLTLEEIKGIAAALESTYDCYFKFYKNKIF